jgi:riboflavin synthase
VFTGLIEEVGQVRRLSREGSFQRLIIGARRVLADLRLGDSVNIDGACQTVVDLAADSFAVESVEETLERTTLGELQVGRPVNLERSLRPQDRLGGHLVLGHVDGVGRISRLEQRQQNWILAIEPPAVVEPYIASKGSIALDGISLTVVEVGTGDFTVSVIPHTFDFTTLARRRVGDRVNLEVDIIARYVERLLTADRAPDQGLTVEKLREMGY